MTEEKAPRGYGVLSITNGGSRKCLLCGHASHVFPLLKVGVRHYVHPRCAIDNDPSILNRMPGWILAQLPLSAFDGQPRAVLRGVLAAIAATRSRS
jgi:hypothetical protein